MCSPFHVKSSSSPFTPPLPSSTTPIPFPSGNHCTVVCVCEFCLLVFFLVPSSPFSSLVRMQIGAATVENSIKLFQKIKHGTSSWPVIPLLGIYPKQSKTLIQKTMYTPILIAALFTIAKIRKLLKGPSVEEWIKNADCLGLQIYSLFRS